MRVHNDGSYIWKHLPYAIYLDTNVLRAAGSRLDAFWINELLSITTEYRISLCISELVLSEWCKHLAGVLGSNLQKLLSSKILLEHYGISMPEINIEEINLPDNNQLKSIVLNKLKNAGFQVIHNWDAPLSQLLEEAISKKPPFEDGGKGLCDAVILESYIKHAKETFPEPRVLVVSRDAAVKRSKDRFEANDFIDEDKIVEKLKSLLNDEVAAIIEQEKKQLKDYVLKFEDTILDFVRKTPLKITDWMLRALGEYSIERNIESVLSVRPIKVTDVIGGALTFGEKIASGRYPVQISIELELDVIVSDYGLGLGFFHQPRAIVQPDQLDSTAPVPLNKIGFDSRKPLEMTETIKRSISLLATLDADKKKSGALDDFRIEKVI